MQLKASLAHVGLLTCVAFLSLKCVQAYWILGCNPLKIDRSDPIVSPGQVSGHVHGILGGNNFDTTYDYNKTRQSTCSSCNVQADLSNYWAPTLYWYNSTGDQTFHAINFYTRVYYLQRPGSKKETINPFPAGFRMIAGNMMRRTYNASNFQDQAVSFVCLDYNNDHSGDPNWAERGDGFFKQQCPDGMRVQIFFPSCWNGKDLDTPDHQSHVAYPVDNYNGGNCPATHPVHLVSIFYEYIYSVADFPFVPGAINWVLSTGDTTGLSFHGDFQNGWDPSPSAPLSLAINQCGLETGGDVSKCPPLAASMSGPISSACRPLNTVVDEPVGFNQPLKALPGCNPLWSGKTSKPTCSPMPATPAQKPAAPVLPSGWASQGCYTEGQGTRALTGSSSVDTDDMTVEECVNTCNTNGFLYAGLEYGSQCFCGQSLLGGSASTNWYECASECPGNAVETCGGANRLSVYKNTNAPAYKPCVKGFSYLGCMKEVTGRLLKGKGTSSSNMTPEVCTSYCQAQNFKYAGIEYGRECYCANSFTGSSAQPATIDEAKCSMPCSGASTKFCGGSSTLSVYQYNGQTTC